MGTAGIAAVTSMVLAFVLLTSWVDRRFAAVAGIAKRAFGTSRGRGEAESLEVPLQPGDRVVIYTDGFIESFNPQEVHQNWLAGM